MADAVLVIDDDDLFREQLSKRLSAAGLDVVGDCASAEQLRDELARLEALDAVVLDLKIGEDNGLTLIPLIHEQFRHCRIVMLTGYGSIPTAVEATRRGAIDYLVKPVDMHRLVALLRGQEDTDTDTTLPEAPPSLARLEWDYIQQVLQENDGNISATARHLGIDRRTLQRKLQKRPSPGDYRRDYQQQSESTDGTSDDH